MPAVPGSGENQANAWNQLRRPGWTLYQKRLCTMGTYMHQGTVHGLVFHWIFEIPNVRRIQQLIFDSWIEYSSIHIPFLFYVVPTSHRWWCLKWHVSPASCTRWCVMWKGDLLTDDAWQAPSFWCFAHMCLLFAASYSWRYAEHDPCTRMFTVTVGQACPFFSRRTRTVSSSFPWFLGSFLPVFCLVLHTGDKPIVENVSSKYFFSLDILSLCVFCTLEKK